MPIQEFETLRTELSQANARWQPAQNTAANLSDNQKRQLLGVIVDPEALAAAMVPAAAVPTPSFAPAVDWRNRNGNHVTPVKDQRCCGSCVSFCTTGVTESMASIERSVFLDLSEADLHFCSAHGANCGGWWPDQAYSEIKGRGIPEEGCFPYQLAFNCPNPAPHCVTRPDRPQRGVKISQAGTLANVIDRKNYLTNVGPCSAVFHVFDDFFSYGSGVYHHQTGPDMGLHCVEVIGYSESQQCWICKNSWGPGWGLLGGFFLIAYGQAGIDTEFPFWWARGIILPNVQRNWRWCHKCQGLYFAGNPTQGICPASGQHDHTGSGNYALVQNQPLAAVQQDWRWCHKCQGLFFGGNSNPICPAGGNHDHTGSGDYSLVQNTPNIPGQDNWRWCHKCQGLFFAGNPSKGVCPAGGSHDQTGSGNYNLIQV
jgi:C1A family cysteine protease